MLKVQNIFKTFNAGTVNEKVALKGLNLELKPGDFVTVIGGNGAGKSTLLNSVAGVFGVDEGKILIDGVDVTHTVKNADKGAIAFNALTFWTACFRNSVSYVRSFTYSASGAWPLTAASNPSWASAI